MLQYFVRHREEILWAAVFAVIFGVIFDTFSPESRTRAAIRYFRNRWAEHSVSQLTRRIRELQDYQKKLASERWIYLFAFQGIFLSLIALSLAAILWIFSISPGLVIYPRVASKLTFAALCCFGAAGGFAGVGFQHVSRDTREKVDAVVRKIGLEIEGLQNNLNDRSPAGGRLDA